VPFQLLNWWDPISDLPRSIFLANVVRRRGSSLVIKNKKRWQTNFDSKFRSSFSSCIQDSGKAEGTGIIETLHCGKTKKRGRSSNIEKYWWSSSDVYCNIILTVILPARTLEAENTTQSWRFGGQSCHCLRMSPSTIRHVFVIGDTLDFSILTTTLYYFRCSVIPL
jgi:hypothetical protein